MISTHSNLSFFTFAFILSFLPLVLGQGIENEGIDRRRFRRVQPGTKRFRDRNETNCKEYREIDGSCTNDIYKAAGSVSTAQFSYTRRLSSKFPTGSDLPSARHVSNVICAQSGDVFNKRGISEFTVFFGQFVDHTIVASTAGNEEFNIPVSPSDPIFANFSKGLPFKRNKRAEPVPVIPGQPRNFGVERPINLLSSALDLASVYSSDKERLEKLREFSGGRMKVSGGNLLPLNTFRLSNAPITAAAFFVAGDHRANEHPVLLAFHTLFVREHNLLAKEFSAAFPEWDDEKLFEEARKFNIAQFQKIVYEEFFRELTGRSIRRSKGYRKNVPPVVSVEFSTAAYRLGHTMIGSVVNLRGPGMSFIPSIPAASMFFPRASRLQSTGIEPFLRGSFAVRAQEVDTLVTDTLRNFLFTNVRGEEGVDLIALNLQRGRDHALPSYNSLRRQFTLRTARSFRDITSNPSLQSRLQTVYGTVDKVEAWIGLMAEDAMPGSSFGPTVFAIWQEEFARLRDGDRFFYSNRGLYSGSIRQRFPKIGELRSSGSTMARIILRNSKITSGEIGRSVWYAR